MTTLDAPDLEIHPALQKNQPGAGLLSRRLLLIGAGSAATAGVAGLMTPRRYEPGVSRARLEDVIPRSVGPWTMQAGGAFILPEDKAATTAYDQVFTRSFSAATGPDIMLLIAHGQALSGLMRVHRPETCYVSSGFQIRGLHSLDLDVAPTLSIAAQSFLGVRDDRVESVLYWTRIAGFFPRDLTAQRLVMLRLGLQGVIPDGVLVRISALGAGETGPALRQFAMDLVRQSGPEARALLIGPQNARTPLAARTARA
jgi:EpsI family protein